MVELIKRWVRSYGLKNVVLRALYEKLPVIHVDKDQLLRRMNWQMHSRQRLKKYINAGEAVPETDISNPYPKTIWVLWLQGIEKAPLIVKKCYQSIMKEAPEMGLNVVVLDESNLFEYVKMPDYIIKKWKTGAIGTAHLSDLCRVTLLCEYGGLWLDATTLLTGRIDREILESDIFFFKASFLDFSATKISSWLMYARNPGNAFLINVRNTLFNYWKYNNIMDDYFMFHLVVAETSTKEPYVEMFNSIPFYTNTYPQCLGRVLNDDFDEKTFERFLKMSNIHKLSYKNLDETKACSYYKHILNMEF